VFIHKKKDPTQKEVDFGTTLVSVLGRVEIDHKNEDTEDVSRRIVTTAALAMPQQ